ncbi:UbiA family prenyltransferase [Tellurirhabdus bombi]|uniref:UbiA family prenyltransferase n=1 Tax=Tellurirhabdus bombi TaxID=2907205 RepID=UPI001F372ED2|nr:UbiA family prenyltransferase [Tellurirhabdus bombi]
MTPRAIWLHLRVPFSFFLLPVFTFALSQSPRPDWVRAGLVLVIIHLLLYPASNAYNSYFDKDEGSIGILEAPPAVDKALFNVAWVLDVVALVLGIWVGWWFVAYLLIYGFISKAYSHPAIRLKKYPLISWVIVSMFQGGFTYIMTLQAINGLPIADVFRVKPLLAGLLCTLNLLAVYPITQVYQHEEDARRGDLTMSRLLGVRGTFLNAIFFFMLSLTGFYVYFNGKVVFWLLPLCLLPGILFFLGWFRRVAKDVNQADFRSAMRMTLLSGLGLNIFFLILLFLRFSESVGIKIN